MLAAFPAGSDGADSLLQALRPRWEALGMAVAEHRLDPRAPEEELVRELATAVEASSGPVVGFSLGARLALQAAASAPLPCLVALGFPFHARGEPRSRPGLDLLASSGVPTLVIQGTRDAHGSRADVAGYDLPDHVRLHWIDDGNHRFAPRQRSGLDPAALLDDVAAATHAFVGGARA